MPSIERTDEKEAPASGSAFAPLKETLN